LLQLVAAVDDELDVPVALQDGGREGPAEGAGTAGQENGLAFQGKPLLLRKPHRCPSPMSARWAATSLIGHGEGIVHLHPVTGSGPTTAACPRRCRAGPCGPA